MAAGTRPPDFADFVRARSASLNRTAILLTHDAIEAEHLLARSLGRALRRWKQAGASPEAFVRRILLREFVRSARRRRGPGDASAQGPEPSRSAMGDPLSGLTPRQRAVVVLRSVHEQSLGQSASALGISVRTAAADAARAAEELPTPSMSELGPLLADVAESYPAPDPGALQVAAHTQARSLRYRRIIGAGVAATALIVSAASGALLLGPGSGTGELVEAAVVDEDYTAGYGLIDGQPKPFVDGLALERREVIDYSLRRRTIAAPEVEQDPQIYAVAYCDLPGNAMDVDAILDAVTIEADEQTVDLSCQDRSADVRTAPLLYPLPRGVQEYAVTVPAAWSGTGALHLSLYREADWSAYPFPPVATETQPREQLGSGEVIDTQTPAQADPALDWLLEEDQQVQSVDVDIDTTLDITLLTTEPGQLLVALDGVVLTNDGEELTDLGLSRPGPWEEADPALRQGFWRGYDASGYHRHLDSGTLSRMGVDITDDTVTVSVVPRGFAAQGWQVIATADGGSRSQALPPGYAATLPDFAHGMRRIGAFEVPTDGVPHPVPMSIEQAEQVTWIGACGIETPYQIRTVTLLTPDRYGLIPCASYRSEWASPLTPVSGGQPRSEAQDDLDPRQGVTLTAATTSERTSLTIAAYEDVPYAEFPFEQTAQPASSQLTMRPIPDEGDLADLALPGAGAQRWREFEAITEMDLDSRGRGTLAIPAEAGSLLRVFTEGEGRFTARSPGADPVVLDGMFYNPSMLGRVASPLMYRDGWWTSWTVQPTEWTIPVPAEAQAAGRVEIGVEGYDPGSLRIEVLRGGPPGASNAAPPEGQ